jgi:uncharacterized protein (TIGR03083 family)
VSIRRDDTASARLPAQQVVDLLEMEWKSIEEFCSTLSASAWSTRTCCPGWTVHDTVAHMVASEISHLGETIPVREDRRDIVAQLTHVHNDVGVRNELNVEYFREWADKALLEEFRNITRQRIDLLRHKSDAEFEGVANAIINTSVYRVFILMRMCDCWVHEQDMRRAVDVVGNRTGPIAETVMDRCQSALDAVIGKRIHPPEGTTVAFEITGDVERQFAVAMVGDICQSVDWPASPLVTIMSDFDTFQQVLFGRLDARRAIEDKSVRYRGESSLANEIMAHCVVMP